MGVTVAGIAGMSLAASTIVAVHPGQTVHLGGYDWTLLGMHDEQGPNYAARVADIRVTHNGSDVAMFHPSRRLFTVQKTTVTDTAIQTNGLRDLYAVLGDERDGTAVLRLHVNPLAPWIWFGALVMAAGARCRWLTGGCASAPRRGVRPVACGQEWHHDRNQATPNTPPPLAGAGWGEGAGLGCAATGRNIPPPAGEQAAGRCIQ